MTSELFEYLPIAFIVHTAHVKPGTQQLIRLILIFALLLPFLFCYFLLWLVVLAGRFIGLYSFQIQLNANVHAHCKGWSAGMLCTADKYAIAQTHEEQQQADKFQ